jgi:predicted AlkP superfamily pyrophosphatase or phosphodiesterase
MSFKRCLVLLILVLSAGVVAARAADTPRVLMISIDGMRPDLITAADAHHLNIPTLRSFIENGTYADGVINSLPANTYPNHTTLVTGVSPALHGIYNNLTFDPLQQHPGEWYWYASAVRVPTLWQAASHAGLITASVGWPVTNGAKGIDFLITELAQSEEGGEIKALDGDNPPNLRNTLDVGHLAKGDDGDEKKILWSTEIIRRDRPNFMTVHINNLDHIQHETGIFSAAANKTLEKIDGQVKVLIHAELAMDPNAKIIIVSDHGFVNVDQRINFGILFIRAGLVPGKQKGEGDIPPDAHWDAAVWDAGGTAAIMLHDPNDEKVKAKVAALLEAAAKDSKYGIARVLTRDQFVPMGGFPNASFLVEWKPGFTSGHALKGEVVVSTPGRGAHGFMPDLPEMHSSCFIMGKGVAAHRDLGIIDMRQIAPTIAEMLAISFPTATLKPVHYQP